LKSSPTSVERWLVAAVCGALTLAQTASGSATTDAKGGPVWPEFQVRRGSWTFVAENDKFFTGTDRHYTNGFKLIWLGETTLDESRDFLRDVANLVPTLRDRAEHQRYKVGFAVGQNLYTPADIDTAALISTERPYAAWLYGSVFLQAEEVDSALLRIVELSLGIVGPSALGRQTQNGWHDIIQVPRAQGWSNQLRDEPALMLSWERRYRFWQADVYVHGRADLIGRVRLTLGNVHTHAAVGFMVRGGWNVPPDFGADLIRPAGGGMANAGPARRFAAYAFLSAETRIVARNVFLDGNTWRDSHSLRKRPVMGSLSAGLVLAWPRFQITYTQDASTKEFYGQLRRDVFGSIALTTFH
jgi:lipid A 3-O-deacylase